MTEAEIRAIAKEAGKAAANEVIRQHMRVLGLDVEDVKQINAWHDTWGWADRSRRAAEATAPVARRALIWGGVVTLVGVGVTFLIEVGRLVWRAKAGG